MKTSVELITPEIAQQYLDRNMKNNRNLNKAKIQRISAEMVQGTWMEAGDPIRFDTNGDMIDGAHRLTGVVSTGVAMKSVVVRDLAPAVKYVIDTGERRTAANMLQIAGVQSNTTLKAAIARLAYSMHTGNFKNATNNGGITRGTSFKPEEMIKWVKVNDAELTKSISAGTRLHSWWGGGSTAGICFAHMLLAKIDPAKADKFFDELSTGVGSGSKRGAGFDPRIALSRTLQELSKGTNTSPKAGVYIYLITTAFTAWDNNKYLPQQIPVIDKNGEGKAFHKSIKSWWI